MTYRRITIRHQRGVCRINLVGSGGESEITLVLIEELERVLFDPALSAKIVVLEGTEEVFCTGADLSAVVSHGSASVQPPDPDRLYRIWLRLAYGPFVSIAHVQGKTTAGGVGFVAACDIALGSACATFALSELLFGLLPACVMPFLERRIGLAKASYMTLMTMPFDAAQVRDWGLLDQTAETTNDLLRRHLLRLNHLSTTAIKDHKDHMTAQDAAGLLSRQAGAVKASHAAFGKSKSRDAISQFLADRDAGKI